MLGLFETKTLYNREKKPYYEVQVFINSLSDLKWVNNYATACHSTDRKQKGLSIHEGKYIELLFYFKEEKYAKKFVGKLEKYLSYKTIA